MELPDIDFTLIDELMLEKDFQGAHEYCIHNSLNAFETIQMWFLAARPVGILIGILYAENYHISARSEFAPITYTDVSSQTPVQFWPPSQQMTSDLEIVLEAPFEKDDSYSMIMTYLSFARNTTCWISDGKKTKSFPCFITDVQKDEFTYKIRSRLEGGVPVTQFIDKDNFMTMEVEL